MTLAIAALILAAALTLYGRIWRLADTNRADDDSDTHVDDALCLFDQPDDDDNFLHANGIAPLNTNGAI